MSGWHQTIIIGHVGRDPESKYTQGGKAVCNFSVAVTEKWNSDNGAQEKTTWYRVAAWGKLAEICNEYVRKGMQIMVTGTVAANAYTNNTGEAMASLELTARDVKFLGKRDNGGGGRNEPQQYPDDVPF